MMMRARKTIKRRKIADCQPVRARQHVSVKPLAVVDWAHTKRRLRAFTLHCDPHFSSFKSALHQVEKLNLRFVGDRGGRVRSANMRGFRGGLRFCWHLLVLTTSLSPWWGWARNSMNRSLVRMVVWPTSWLHSCAVRAAQHDYNDLLKLASCHACSCSSTPSRVPNRIALVADPRIPG